MTDWGMRLRRCLDIGVASDELFEDLDEILSWYATLNGDASSFSDEIISHYGEMDFRKKFEVFLDHLVIANPNNHRVLFTSSASQEHARKRYRHLIRVFHPDKGVNEQEWLNYRAERINKAYESFQKTASSSVAIDSSISVFDDNASPEQFKRPANKNNKDKFGIRYRPAVWRQWLGDPNVLQRRILLTVSGIALVGVIVIFASTIEDSSRVTQIDNPGIDTASEQETNMRIILDEPFTSPSSVEDGLGVTEIMNQDANQPEVDEERWEALDEELAFFDNEPNSPVAETIEYPEQRVDSVELDEEEPSIQLNNKQKIVSEASEEAEPLQVQTPKRKEVEKLASTSPQPDVVKSEPLPEEKVVPSDKDLKLTSNEKLNVDQQDPPTKKEMDVEIATSSGSSQLAQKEVYGKAKTKLEIEKIISDYKQYYKTGDLEGLLSLFIESGRVNEARGFNGLSKTYKDFFDETQERDIEFSVFSVAQDDLQSALVSGTVNVSAITKKGEIWNPGVMVFKMALIKSGKQLKIAVYDWHST